MAETVPYWMGCGVSGPALCGVRWSAGEGGAQRLERSARHPTPPDSARLLCLPPFAWRAAKSIKCSSSTAAHVQGCMVINAATYV